MMNKMDQIVKIQYFKSLVDEDWENAFSNLTNLQEKMRQIDQIIGGPQNVTFDTEKVKADLISIRKTLLQFNVLCKNRRNYFTSAKVPIDDNKWMHYPQYPIPDFTTYTAGSHLKGAISYIKDPNKGIFYLMDFGRSAKEEFSSVYRLLQKKTDMKRITDLRSLQSGDLIALQIDDTITRALVEVTTDSFTFFLIDSGEEVDYNENMLLYEMAKTYKHLPALGILCKCDDSSSEYMRKHLHHEAEVEVLKVNYNTIHVKFVNPLIKVEPLLAHTNPFTPDVCAKKISEVVKVKQEPNNNNKESGSEMGAKKRAKKRGSLILTEQGKHPVPILRELAAKHKWEIPEYDVTEQGPNHAKLFVYKVRINGIEYEPGIAMKRKREARAMAAKFCLKQMGA